MEGREVPAALTWVGNGTLPFMHYQNWSPSQTPANGDDLFFNSYGSPVSTTAITPPSIQFNSIHLQSGYPGTVSLYTPGAFNDIELRSGAIALTGTDISVANDLTWTGGTLHNATHLRTVSVLSGATATIDPGVGNTVVSGANLSFHISATGVGAQGIIKTGILQFTNGAGAVVGGTYQPSIFAKLELKTGAKLKGGVVTANTGGECLVNGPGIAECEAPVSISGGTLKVENGATLNVTSKFSQQYANDSIYTSTSSTNRIYVQAGSTLAAIGNIQVLGGKLATLAGSSGGTQTATIITPKLFVWGGDVVVNDDAFTPPGSYHTSGVLHVEGQVRWEGGAFRPVINAGDNSCDKWTSTQLFSVANGVTLAPGTVNGTPPTNTTYLLIESGVEIVGSAPPVVGGLYEVVPSGSNPKKWYLRKL